MSNLNRYRLLGALCITGAILGAELGGTLSWHDSPPAVEIEAVEELPSNLVEALARAAEESQASHDVQMAWNAKVDADRRFDAAVRRFLQLKGGIFE